MVSFNSFTSITASVLVLQSLVSAAPIDTTIFAKRSLTSLTGKFLHITDIHIDPHYVSGSNTGDYCHTYSKRDTAGKYGALDSDCDSPIALVDATFAYLKNNIQDIDFIVYTGDTVRHDRDDKLPRTDNEIIAGHKSVLKYFTDNYDVSSIPVFPTIGNNDPYVHDQALASDSIFTQLKTIWQPLNLNLTSDFTTGGYFIQNIIPNKLSIVNINTMYFFEDNTAVADCSSSSSPAAIHMNWLKSVLQTYAAKSSHKLYLMGHVPPIDEDGNKLYKSNCYTQYFNLIGQYGNIIAGHFAGHTNKDTIDAVYKSGSSYKFLAPDDTGANSKTTLSTTTLGLFNGPSIIPKNNPAFRVYNYEIQGTNYPVGTILDWTQYYLDLNKANANNVVNYQVEYTASSFYKVNHFDAAGVASAVYNVASVSSAVDQYKDYRKVDP